MNYTIRRWAEWIELNSFLYRPFDDEAGERIVLVDDLMDFLMGREPFAIQPAPHNPIPFTTYNKEL